MNINSAIKKAISEAFQAQFGAELPVEEVKLQPCRKDFEGTHTFLTFPFARISKKNPEQTAQVLGEYLKENSEVIADFNVVKGFLNLVLEQQVWVDALKTMAADDQYGFAASNGKKVMVEYSSPNTNKPLHLGHLRNNFLGYSVSEILKAAGYEVQKVNLVNDRGIHICKSMLAYLKFGEGETPSTAGIKGDKLVGNYYVKYDQEYKKEVQALVAEGKSEEDAKKEAPLMVGAQKMLRDWEAGEEEVVALWKKMNGWVYDGFNATYKTMGVDFDKFYYESDTYLLGKDIVNDGLEKGVFFKKDDNSVWADLSNEGLDEKLVLRGDGTSVYITQDMGTADLKHKDFAFDQSIYVVGNEQDYHFDVLFRILKNVGREYAEGMYHLSYGMVDLPSGKMKSREGTVVDADDLMQEMFDTAEAHTKELGKIDGFTEAEASALYRQLGLGALKYFLLKVDPKRRMMFNPEESIQFQGNTGPFIQYTHARISAISRKAKEQGIDTSNIGELTDLQPSEIEGIRLLSTFPDVIKEAASNHSPAVIANFCFELAKEYNRFYAEVAIFNEEDPQKLAFRVAFSEKVAEVIRRGMQLLGVEAPNRM
ncbi:arginine--tRNA ligase [Persicobacter psychrovividus]|uniref:Arginine--tRNA ligase n=1 Tax=Persicobacter psychrovividus TaxID=387638 RepID=A0ABN6L9Q9_9BACT|nr:arginine--tRNA ligase [Persicobacter psychrovividus]